MRSKVRFSLFASLVALAACSDGTAPGSAVSVRMSVKAPTAGSAMMGSAGIAEGSRAAQELEIAGSNGTLRITDIRVIVDELELKRVEDGTLDCDADPEPEACEEFEAGPFFVAVPLTGEPVTVTSQDIPEGSYDELEFEVDDIEVDDDEGDEAQVILDLLNTVRQEFADWPGHATMLVVGTFTPTGGEAVAFRVYFEAEVEVELDIDPPLVVGASGGTVNVALDPAAWFKRADGTVVDLSAWDFATTGEVIEFELEMEDGFELEIDD